MKNEDGVLPLERDKSAAFIGKFAVAPATRRWQLLYQHKDRDICDGSGRGMEHITYAPGYDGIYPDEKLIAEAEAAAKEADVAVILPDFPPIWRRRD